MIRVLIVKITSMGDLIQMLPALSDAAQALPGIQFDWLVEESFMDIPKLHPTVANIIVLPYRRWKKNKKQALLSGEIRSFVKQLRNQHYDMVIDAQSNLKSAFVSLLARGTRYGLDASSVREYGAQWAYQNTITIDRNQNHALRMRKLLAQLLHYHLPDTPIDYGIRVDKLPQLDFVLPEQFIFMVPIASVANKLWPEAYWQEVVQDVVASGYEIVLPWWSKEEKERVLRLKNQHPKIHLLPNLDLAQKARVLSGARAVISIDTGLAHMSAALNIPNICLYGPTNPQHCGTYGVQQIHLRAGDPDCAPCLKTKCSYEGVSSYQPACLESLKPQTVLKAFYEVVSPKNLNS